MSTHEIVLFFNGVAGQLESLYAEQSNPKGCVLICHPHPLYSGTMQNKVVTTIERTAYNEGWDTLRFNFRGVGKSEGSFGEGEGEIEDALAAARYLLTNDPNRPLIMVGFSFGACVAACATQILEQEANIQQLVMIAPAIEMFDIETRIPEHCPLLVIQPEADEVVNPALVYNWSASLVRSHTLVSVPECSHFFHGHLNDLKTLITPYL